MIRIKSLLCYLRVIHKGSTDHSTKNYKARVRRLVTESDKKNPIKYVNPDNAEDITYVTLNHPPIAQAHINDEIFEEMIILTILKNSRISTNLPLSEENVGT